MLWPKASPLDLDFGLCAWAKLFNVMPSILGKQKKHKCEFCNYRSDLKYNFDRHVKRCSEYENVLMRQERPQSIYKIDNSIPSILGKQNKHKCEFCNYSSDRKHDVKRQYEVT